MEAGSAGHGLLGANHCPQDLAIQSTAKTLGRLWTICLSVSLDRSPGRITYSILRTPSNSPTVRSSLPLLSVSSPPLPSLIPRDSSPAQTRPCSPCPVSSLAPTLICSQKEHTNSSSVFCIHSLSFWKILWAMSITGIMRLILPLAVKWWWEGFPEIA